MVDYKTRIFYEAETGMMGAEVRLYSEEGENIDNIVITSESKLKEIAEKVLEMDDTYIDRDELTSILLNASETLTINATRFQGYVPADFARALHSHSEYAQINHATPQDVYGKGTPANYGHNKLINNLTSSSYVDGEALAAYQGKVLKDAIDTAVANICKWEKVTLSGHNNVASYCNLYVNTSLRLARITYNRTEVKKGVGSSKDSNNRDKNPSPYWIVGEATNGTIYLHKEGAIPDAYQPSTRVTQPFYRGDFVFRVDTDGSISVHNVNGKGSKDTGVNIRNNILYYY